MYNQIFLLTGLSQFIHKKKARTHKIKNLGDVPSLKYKQIWEKKDKGKRT